MNLYWFASVALIESSLAKINGLIYNELPKPGLIQALSSSINFFKLSKNNSFGNSGIASLIDDFNIRS